MQMPRFVYFILSLLMDFFAVLMIFGLLASQEPGVHIGWTIAYSMGIFVFTVAALYFLYLAFKQSDA